MTATNLHNWAGNVAYTAARVHSPQTVEQIRQIVIDSRKVRALGTRHCFNDIADSPEDLISTQHLNRVLKIDHANRTASVEAGIRYGELGEHLHREGFALHNMASLPHISVGGAVATATHGSGEKNGNLATAVRAMEIVLADGSIATLTRDQLEFHGMVVGLGGFGIVTKLTLDLEPTFAVRQDVYENLPLEQLEKHFDAIQSAAYSVSLFTDWRGERINQVWLKHRVDGDTPIAPAANFFAATAAHADRHPIGEILAENCTPQMGVIGAWHERLPHFRMDFLPSSGEELQSEYFVPRHHAVNALRAVAQLRQRIAPLLLISEIRTIDADSLWMSPCYQQACVAIHFTWKPDWPAVRELLPLIESHLAPFDARPHWGKLFTMPAARLRSLYKKMPDFQQLLQSCDPSGKFRNAFLETHIFGSSPA